MEQHLPALQVVVPLVGALLAALVRQGTAAWGVALATTLAAAAIAARLLTLVLASGPISYRLGGWAPDLGIEYRVDVVNALVLLLVAMMAALVVAMALRSVRHEIAPDRQGWFFAMLLVCLAGLLGIAITGDAFNAFVFLEVSSLSTCAMVALGRDRRALLAAYQYLILGTIGATFYVIGVGLLYIETGTLNLALIAERLPAVGASRAVVAALAFIVVGIGLKAAIFPLHRWLPNAYAFAPSVATLLLASTATKVALYLLARYLFGIFGAGFALSGVPVGPLLIALSIAAMFGASAVAVVQSDLKRLLAYSSVGQIGYITLGFGVATPAGVAAGFLHLVNHAVMKGALFAAVAAMVYRTGATQIDDLAGIGRRMPLTMAAFTVAGLGLIGVPGTAGFVSKWFLVTAAFADGLWWVGLLVVASSLIAVLYVGRMVEAAFLRSPSPAVAAVREGPAEIVAVAVILAAATIWFGFDTGLTVGTAQRAAAALLGGEGN